MQETHSFVKKKQYFMGEGRIDSRQYLVNIHDSKESAPDVNNYSFMSILAKMWKLLFSQINHKYDNNFFSFKQNTIIVFQLSMTIFHRCQGRHGCFFSLYNIM